MIISFKTLLALLLITALSCNASRRTAAQTGEIFKSSTFTPVKSFTKGAEGPAVDKSGNLYAVNFAHDGTVGMITPSGQASIFFRTS